MCVFNKKIRNQILEHELNEKKKKKKIRHDTNVF